MNSNPTQRLTRAIEKQFHVRDIVIYGNEASLYHDKDCLCGFRNHCRLIWHSIQDKIQGVVVLHNCDTSKADCFIDKSLTQ